MKMARWLGSRSRVQMTTGAIVMAALAMAAAGCGSSGGGSTGGGSASSASRPWVSWLNSQAGGAPRMAIVICQAANPYWIPGRVATSDVSKMLGVPVKFTGPPQNDTPAEISQFKELVNAGYDAIGVSVCGSGWDRVINDAISKGVLVVTQEADAPNSKREVFFGTDYVATGTKVGQLMVQRVPKGGQVAVTNIAPGAPQVDADVNAVVDQVKAAGDTVVGPFPVDPTDPAKLRSQMENIYRAHPNLAGWAGCCAPDTAEAGKINARHGKKFVVVGQGELPDTLAGIQQGAIYGTYVANPYNQVYTTLMYMFARVGLHQPKLTLQGQHYPTGGILVTKSQVKDWITYEKRFGG